MTPKCNLPLRQSHLPSHRAKSQDRLFVILDGHEVFAQFEEQVP
jgi:hypothetical protein